MNSKVFAKVFAKIKFTSDIFSTRQQSKEVAKKNIETFKHFICPSFEFLSNKGEIRTVEVEIELTIL